MINRPLSGRERLVAHVRETLPDVPKERSEIARTARFWLEWNSMIEQRSRRRNLPYVRYRLESYTAHDFHEILGHIGTPDLGTVEQAFCGLPRDVNTGPSVRALTWEQLRPWEQPVRALARRYGYLDGLHAPGAGTNA
jgi:hypothetical protein